MADSLLRRVQALEARQSGSGRMIVVMGCGPVERHHVDDAITVRGIQRRAGDGLLVFVTKYETEDGGIDPSIVIYSVTETARRAGR